jgi:tetratricopeptide (TPR) repeat protein
MKSLMVKVVLSIILIFLFTYASAQKNQSESRDAEIYAEFYFNRGLDYANKGQLDQAISDYTKALEMNPRNAAAYNNRGIAYFHKREYKKSWTDVEKARSLGYQIDPEFLDNLRKASGRQN